MVGIFLGSAALAAAVIVGGWAGEGRRCCLIASLRNLPVVDMYFGFCLGIEISAGIVGTKGTAAPYLSFVFAGCQTVGRGDVIHQTLLFVLIVGPCHMPPATAAGALIRLEGFQFDGAFIGKGQFTAQKEGIVLPRSGIRITISRTGILALGTGRFKNRTILDGQVTSHNDRSSAANGKISELGLHGGIVGENEISADNNRCTGISYVVIAAICNQFAGSGDGNGAGGVRCIDGIEIIGVTMITNRRGALQFDIQITLRQSDKGNGIPSITCIELGGRNAVDGKRRGSRLPLDIVIVRGSAGLGNAGFTIGVLIKPVAYLAR